MTVRSVARGVLLCAGLGAAAAMAVTAPNLPPERQQGTVVYRTGGIGEDEAKAMQEAARQYPLALEFVARTGDGRGAWLADVAVSIRDSRGNAVLQTRAEGPFLLARLPAGRYTVTARYQDAERTRRIDIADHGEQHVIFGW
jgi:hypothetical protein